MDNFEFHWDGRLPSETVRMRIAFGPEASAFGSWEWVGADLSRALALLKCDTEIFYDAVPECDVVVFVKFKPAAE